MGSLKHFCSESDTNIIPLNGQLDEKLQTALQGLNPNQIGAIQNHAPNSTSPTNVSNLSNFGCRPESLPKMSQKEPHICETMENK